MEGQGKTAIMTSDEHFILELLLLEIDTFRKGGVVRLLDTPWLLKSIFRDSVLNLDHGYTQQTRPCSECQPFYYVSASHDFDDVPCHHTFLNEGGVRIEQPEDEYTQPRFEHALANWLRARITEIKSTSH